MIKDRLYHCWINMRQRCNAKKGINFKYYKNKKIEVCNEWNNFQNFKEWAINNGYNDDLTIDRIDNNKGYSPENCRWATIKEQANNKTNNKLITFKGQTKTIHEWEDICGIKACTINRRLNLGWNVERALTEKSFIGKNQYYKQQVAGMRLK